MESLFKSKDYLTISGDEAELIRLEKSKNEKKRNKRNRSDSSASDSSSSYSSNCRDSKIRRNKGKNKRNLKHSVSRSRSISTRKSRRSEKNKSSKTKREGKRKHRSSSSSSSYSSKGRSSSSSRQSNARNLKTRKNKAKKDFYQSSDDEKYKIRKSKWTEVYSDEEKHKAESNGNNSNNQDQLINKAENKADENKPTENIQANKSNLNDPALLKNEAKANTLNSIELKFLEPSDASEPTEEWRLYSFKDNNVQDILQINKQRYYLIGKDDRICNIIVNHPSCSRQHAVLQYRKSELDGMVRPYMMDLGSTNGTQVNKTKMHTKEYYELKNYDMINFGMSTRDYILIKGDNIDYKKLNIK